jgi:hypothetical protein
MFSCPGISEIVLFTWYQRWWLQPHRDGWLGTEGDAQQGLDIDPVPPGALASVAVQHAPTETERTAALMDAVARAGG